MEGRKLEWLDVMRGLAACWVLVHHANQSVGYFIGPIGAGSVAISRGYLGVDFFFVLSGFIIAFSSNRLLSVGGGLSDYVKARFIRIYVPYLPVGIGMLLLYMMLPDISASDRIPGVLTSLTLFPTASPPALSVAWTLIHEMLFYVLFSVFFVSRTALWLVLTLWAACIVYHAFLGQVITSGFKYVLAPINLCFLLGVGAYYLTLKGVSTYIAVISFFLGISAIVFEVNQQSPSDFLIAIGFAGLIIAAVSERARRYSPGRFLLFIGAASYSIYLVHEPMMSIAVRGAAHFAPHILPIVAFMVIATIGLISGIAYYYFYERHGLIFVKKLFSSPSPASYKNAIPEAAK